MCRITGGLDFSNNHFSPEVLTAMRDSLIAGGPDNGDLLIDGNMGLAHRRLSIIDLSAAANQPMVSDDWVISYNGEIYNFMDIRNQLMESGYSFSTKSDTEVIIKAIDHWGKDAVNRFRGMFAFALWNKVEKRLLLCRDRLGVKPLYWYFHDDLFLFASEIKAFHQHPSFNKSLDLSGLPHFLQKGYFHSDECIYKYVKKVPPGSFLEINASKEIAISSYWNPKDIYRHSLTDKRSEDEITEELEHILTESFKLRMVADVEVGVFLSGGIDSSLVTALLQKENTASLRTFTIGFHDKMFNEAEVAAEVAKQLGTNHSALYCSEEEFKQVIPELPEIYDEPFADSSAIPTYLVSKLARGNVKVALSGDGGDELFGGYSKYKFARLSAKLLSIPLTARKILYEMSYLVSPDTLESLSTRFKLSSYSQVGSKYLKFQQTLLSKDLDDFFDKSSSYMKDTAIKKLTGITRPELNGKEVETRYNLVSYLGMKDMLSYLPGDILTKVDRASMHVALESREPFLDPKVIAFAFTIPDHLKINERGESKYLLRKILGKYISPDLINRPKQGFTPPIAKWLRGFLKEELIVMENDPAFFELFQLNQEYYKQILRSFLAGEHKYNPHFIWFIYCLYKWYKRWI